MKTPAGQKSDNIYSGNNVDVLDQEEEKYNDQFVNTKTKLNFGLSNVGGGATNSQVQP